MSEKFPPPQEAKSPQEIYEQEAEANFKAGRWSDAGATYEYLLKLAVNKQDFDAARLYAYRAGVCWRNAGDRIRLGILYRDSGLLSLKAAAHVALEHVHEHESDPIEKAKGHEIAGESFLYFDRAKALEHLKISAELYKTLGLEEISKNTDESNDLSMFYMKKAVAELELIGESDEINDVYRIMAQIRVQRAETLLASETANNKQTAAKELIHAADLFKKIGENEEAANLRKRADELISDADIYTF